MSRPTTALLLALSSLLAVPALAADPAPAAPAAKPPAPGTEPVICPITGLNLKKIELAQDPATTLAIGGELRLRYENWNHDAAFGGRNDDLLLGRLLLDAKLKVGDALTVFAQGKFADETGRSTDLVTVRRTQDVDTAELQQAWAQIQLGKPDDRGLAIKAGRVALQYGNQRLISPLPWLNTERAWDGVVVKGELGKWDIDAFWTQYVPVAKYQFNTSTDDEIFTGIYATGPAGGTINLDAYALYRDRNPHGALITVSEELTTLGARMFTAPVKKGLDLDAELAYQTGNLNALDISAYMLAVEAGYNLGNAGKTRVCAGLDYASGDDNAADGNYNTFTQLYPLGHKYFGQIDAIGRQNIIDLWAGVKTNLGEKLTLKGEAHWFKLAEAHDAIYNAAGGALRAGGGGFSETDVGIELDVTATCKVNRFLTLEAGYGHLFAGDALGERTGGNAEDIDFLYAQAAFKF